MCRRRGRRSRKGGGRKLICDKCKRPIMQDRVYFRVEVRTENQEHPFVGEYFFHTECWDDVLAKLRDIS